MQYSEAPHGRVVGERSTSRQRAPAAAAAPSGGAAANNSTPGSGVVQQAAAAGSDLIHAVRPCMNGFHQDKL